MFYKIIAVIMLGILIGLVAWDIAARSSLHETRLDSTHFMWVKCPSCGRMFYVENNQKEGWCPYDGIQFNFASNK
jgi:acetyl-CoA carboxylase beta subunit